MRKVIACFLLAAFLLNSLLPWPAYAQSITAAGLMPQAGAKVALTAPYDPACLVGMTIKPDLPFEFDFLVNRGDGHLTENQREGEYSKLIKYFLAALAVPDTEQWVNLSPYEKDRIIPDSFGLTEMGRDLLAQDYLLKQLASSLTDPGTELGKRFWDGIYEQARKKFGSTDVPLDVFNKVWIVPDKAEVFEKNNTVYVLENHLKVMTEQDYWAGKRNETKQTDTENKTADIASRVLREVIIPVLEKEVNEGQLFAPLRQVFSGMLLATWYKRTLKETILGKVYADQGKVLGVNQDPRNNQAVYARYLEAFRKGVINLIQEDVDKYTHEMLPRKYFSGGAYNDYAQALNKVDEAKLAALQRFRRMENEGIYSVSAAFVFPDKPQQISPESLADGWGAWLTLKVLPYEVYRYLQRGSAIRELSESERKRAVEILLEIIKKSDGKDGREFKDYAVDQLDTVYAADNGYVRGVVYLCANDAVKYALDNGTIVQAAEILMGLLSSGKVNGKKLFALSDSAQLVSGLSSHDLPRIIEMEIVRNAILKNPDRFMEFALYQNNAYAKAHGYPLSDKPLTDKEVYRNMAGVFATLEAAALIAERDGRKLREVANEVVAGALNEADKLLMVRMAHATWLSTQPDDGFSRQRYLRPIVMPAQQLTAQQIQDDLDQIKAAGETLLMVISEVVADDLDTPQVAELQAQAEGLISLIKQKAVLSEADEIRIRKTALTVIFAHREQLRKQGTPYAEHPLGVAQLMFKVFGSAEPLVQYPVLYAVGALLHDTREDQEEFFIQFKNYARNVILQDRSVAGREKMDRLNSVLLIVRMLSKLTESEKNQGAEDELLAKYYEIMVNPRDTYNRPDMPYYDDGFIRAVQLIKLSDILYNAGDLVNLFVSANSAEEGLKSAEKARKAFNKVFDFALPILVMKSAHLLKEDVDAFFLEYGRIIDGYVSNRDAQYAPLAAAAREAAVRLADARKAYEDKNDAAMLMTSALNDQGRVGWKVYKDGEQERSFQATLAVMINDGLAMADAVSLQGAVNDLRQMAAEGYKWGDEISVAAVDNDKERVLIIGKSTRAGISINRYAFSSSSILDRVSKLTRGVFLSPDRIVKAPSHELARSGAEAVTVAEYIASVISAFIKVKVHENFLKYSSYAGRLMLEDARALENMLVYAQREIERIQREKRAKGLEVHPDRLEYGRGKDIELILHPNGLKVFLVNPDTGTGVAVVFSSVQAARLAVYLILQALRAAPGSALGRPFYEAQDLLGYIQRSITDNAMLISSNENNGMQESGRVLPYGGIDFAQSNLDLMIKRDGAGVVLPVSQQNLDNISIDGLVPVIIKIQPVNIVPLLTSEETGPAAIAGRG